MTEYMLSNFDADKLLVFFSGAILALSVFSTILLFWLGFTLLLTAARRNLGIWMAALGLFAGGVFFLDHTALVVLDLTNTQAHLGAWWHVGWVALIIAPFAWYGAVLVARGLLGGGRRAAATRTRASARPRRRGDADHAGP